MILLRLKLQERVSLKNLTKKYCYQEGEILYQMSFDYDYEYVEYRCQPQNHILED